MVVGTITDLSGDSNANLTVTIETAEGFKKTTSTLISLARKLGKDKQASVELLVEKAKLLLLQCMLSERKATFIAKFTACRSSA